MNLPVSLGVGTVGWHTFRIPAPPGVRRRCPDTGRSIMVLNRRDDVTDWCMEFVKGPWAERRSQGNDLHTFQIKDGKDALLFKLTWCNDTVKPKFPKSY